VTTGTVYHNGALVNLTRGLILHAIITGITALSLLIACGAHCCGFLFASAIAGFAWILTLVVLVIDLSLFGTARVRAFFILYFFGWF
jgi:hypothetical protein